MNSGGPQVFMQVQDLMFGHPESVMWQPTGQQPQDHPYSLLPTSISSSPWHIYMTKDFGLKTVAQVVAFIVSRSQEEHKVQEISTAEQQTGSEMKARPNLIMLTVTLTLVITTKTMPKKSNYRKKQSSCILYSDFIMFPATLLILCDVCISLLLKNSDLPFAEILLQNSIPGLKIIVNELFSLFLL